MKANRWSKDEDGADSSDAIIALALILGIALVAVYMGHAISGWGGEVVEGVQNWLGGVGHSINTGISTTVQTITAIPMRLFTTQPLLDFWLWVTGYDPSSVEISDDFLRAMYDEDYFTLQNEANESQQLKGIISSFVGNNTRRYSLTNETGRSAVDAVFQLRNAKTFMISDEFFEKLGMYDLNEELTLKGKNYTAKIAAQRLDEIAQYRLEITKIEG